MLSTQNDDQGNLLRNKNDQNASLLNELKDEKNINQSLIF